MRSRANAYAAGEKATEGSGLDKGDRTSQASEEGQKQFDCATWLHKARQMPKEDFKKEVEKELTGRETEPWEIIYFELYQSQTPVIEKAIETAALMLGTDRSRGYSLEIICADFLAGANLDKGDPETLLFSMTRFFKFLPGEQRQVFLEGLREKASCVRSVRSPCACGWIPWLTRLFGSGSCVATAGGVNRAAQCRIWRFTTNSFSVTPAMIPT